jgi:hypothetical protein
LQMADFRLPIGARCRRRGGVGDIAT